MFSMTNYFPKSVSKLWPIVTALVAAVVLIAVWNWGFENIEHDRADATSSTSVGDSTPSATASPSISVRPALNEANDRKARIGRSRVWPIPHALRLPGGPSEFFLADTPEAWLLSLPRALQPTAQAFLERNSEAYEFSSKAEQVWLVENGFPTLEEAAFFAGLPRSATCAVGLEEIKQSAAGSIDIPPCSHPKLAALSADLQLTEIISIQQMRVQGDDLLQVGDAFSVSPRALESVLLSAEVEQLLSRSLGAYRFYQRASLARAKRRSDPLDPTDTESIALALAYACEGDRRLHRSRAGELWSRPAAQSVVATLNVLGADLRRADGGAVCGYSSLRAFPGDE